MDHIGTKYLETERLILRKFELEDYELAFNNWMSDDKVTKYLSWPTHPNKELSKEIISSWINEYKNDNYYQWAICLKDNIPIGSISTVSINEKLNEVEIGYCLSYNYWNQGIMTEVCKKIIDLFLYEVKVNKVIAKHDSRNIGSGKVMIKSGMKYIDKKEIKNKNEKVITLIYEISVNKSFV